MIKTLIDDNIDELDKRCNEFMREQGKNLPVRTETFLFEMNGVPRVFHKSTIFFDKNFNEGLTVHEETIYDDEHGVDTSKPIPKSTPKYRPKSFDAPKKTAFKDESVGALWWSDSGESISGKINDKKITLNDADMDILSEVGTTSIVYEKITYIIKVNEWKKQKTHPDFKIYKK